MTAKTRLKLPMGLLLIAEIKNILKAFGNAMKKSSKRNGPHEKVYDQSQTLIEEKTT